ncbi:translation initiation factor eIF5A [Fusarium chlamydosporum]
MAEENAFDLALGETNVSRKECSSVEEGDYVLMQGRPCKIVEMSASRRNRHGHSKVHLVGIDIFTGKKFEDMSASTHEVEIPEVSRGEYRL